MGIAAMVIGIISAILAFIPFCGYIAFVPAVVGLILGIIDVSMKSKKNLPKGQGVAGIILNAIAIVIIFVYTMMFAAGTTQLTEELSKGFSEGFESAMTNAINEVQTDMTEMTKELEKTNVQP